MAALALVATGCGRGGDDDGGEASAPGVTEEACPDAVNEDNGCIYLGTISDLTQGPFAPLGVPITEAQKAFWQRVNEDGGIGGYDIDVTTYVKDNLYNPETHKQVYGEIEGDVLATFVVDTTGRADPASFKVLRATHQLFERAVRDALPRMRFVPAEVGGRKVRQLVQQPFSFAIIK